MYRLGVFIGLGYYQIADPIVCFVWAFALPFKFAVGGLGLEFGVFVVGWRHAFRSKWHFILLLISAFYYEDASVHVRVVIALASVQFTGHAACHRCCCCNNCCFSNVAWLSLWQHKHSREVCAS